MGYKSVPSSRFVKDIFVTGNYTVAIRDNQGYDNNIDPTVRQSIEDEIWEKLFCEGKSKEEIILQLRRREAEYRKEYNLHNYNIFKTEFARQICLKHGITIENILEPTPAEKQFIKGHTFS